MLYVPPSLPQRSNFAQLLKKTFFYELGPRFCAPFPNHRPGSETDFGRQFFGRLSLYVREVCSLSRLPSQLSDLQASRQLSTYHKFRSFAGCGGALQLVFGDAFVGIGCS